MTIHIQEEERSFQIALPTNLIFSRFLLRLGLKYVKINGSRIEGLSAETVDKLAREIRRIKKTHGSWDLVEVQSADGEYVKITL